MFKQRNQLQITVLYVFLLAHTDRELTRVHRQNNLFVGCNDTNLVTFSIQGKIIPLAFTG